MAEFANVFCVCFGRRSFELVRTVFYLRGMSAIVRTGPRRSSNRPRSSAKIRLSRGQKQIYLCFAEAEYLRRSQRLGLSRAQKQILFAFCRGEVSKTKSKITIRPRAKANFICVLPQRSTSKIVKAGSVCTRRSALRRRSGEHCVAVVRCARRISTPFAPHRCGTNGKVWPAAESYYFVLILKNRA